jgi:hypothetical protein
VGVVHHNPQTGGTLTVQLDTRRFGLPFGLDLGMAGSLVDLDVRSPGCLHRHEGNLPTRFRLVLSEDSPGGAMGRKGRSGKRMVKRKSSYAPGAVEGDQNRDVAHRGKHELRRGKSRLLVFGLRSSGAGRASLFAGVGAEPARTGRGDIRPCRRADPRRGLNRVHCSFCLLAMRLSIRTQHIDSARGIQVTSRDPPYLATPV